MKKILIAALALITVLTMSLTSCENNPNPDDSGNGLNDDLISRDDDETTEGDETTTGDDSQTPGDTTNKPQTPTGAWIEKSETVYVLGDSVNLRATNSSNGTLVASVNMGETLQRVKMQDVNETLVDGWSEVTYKGQTAYVLSVLLTTNANDAAFEACEEKTITLDSDISYVWLRHAPADRTDVTKAKDFSAETFNAGSVTLVAVNKSNTWAKVKYNGGYYYLGVSTFDGSTSSTPGGLG